MKKFSVFVFLLFICHGLSARQVTELPKGPATSIRGMSVVSSTVVWLSGSKGWFARSKDGGRSWDWKQLKEYAAFDFRGVAAFSASKAVLMSSGSPAVILYTEDGGENWKESYRNESKEIFLDGISFYNGSEGLVYGDPIQGKMQLLKTEDGGKSWVNISEKLTIPLAEGEASFAASNTGIETRADGRTWIITGGKASRVFYSPDKGESWRTFDCPMLHGKETQGPFSICFYDKSRGAMAGGDYQEDTLSRKNFFVTEDGGATWSAPVRGPSGFRSCVAYISKNILIATGTSGTDISKDGGLSWTSLSSQGYHVVSVLQKNRSALLAGSDGRIALIRL